MALAIIVNLEPRRAIVRQPHKGVCMAERRLTGRPTARVGIAQDHAPEVSTAAIGAARATPDRNGRHTSRSLRLGLAHCGFILSNLSTRG